MNYQELINKNIKHLRLNHNLTQEEFSEKIGISIQDLSNIERNRYQPTAQTIDSICKIFKITPVELLIDRAQDNNGIIDNINSLLANCSKRKLKKIYDIISIIVKL